MHESQAGRSNQTPPTSPAMTVFAIIAGLLPIMWSHGTGAGRLSPQILGLTTENYDPLVHYYQVRDSWFGCARRRVDDESQD
jgi:hypothetical protein